MLNQTLIDTNDTPVLDRTAVMAWIFTGIANQAVSATLQAAGNTIKVFEAVTGLDVKPNVSHDGIEVEARDDTFGLLNNQWFKLDGEVIKVKISDGNFGMSSNGRVRVNGVKVTSYNTEMDKNGVVVDAHTGLYFSTDSEYKGRLIRMTEPEDLDIAGKETCEKLGVSDIMGYSGIDSVFNAICPGMNFKELCDNLSEIIWYYRVDGGVGVGIKGVALKNGMDTTISFFSKDKGDMKVDFTCYGCSGLCPIDFFIGVSKKPVGEKKYAIYLAPSLSMALEFIEAGASGSVHLVLAFDDEEVKGLRRLKVILI